MKCAQCGHYKETAEDLRKCGTCALDGTGSQVPADLPDGTSMEEIVLLRPGLANRFHPGRDPYAEAAETSVAPEVETKIEETAEEKPGILAKVKAAVTGKRKRK